MAVDGLPGLELDVGEGVVGVSHGDAGRHRHNGAGDAHGQEEGSTG